LGAELVGEEEEGLMWCDFNKFLSPESIGIVERRGSERGEIRLTTW